MKKFPTTAFLHIIASTAIGLFLTACDSSTPSASDVEDYIESKFTSCENIKLKNIKKTNGYQDDKYYKVDFEYTIKLKNSSHLNKLKKIYKEEEENITNGSKQKSEHVKELMEKAEINYRQYIAIVAKSKTKPQRPEFIFKNQEEEQQYRVNLEQWEATDPDYLALREYEKIFYDMEKEWRDARNNYADDMHQSKIYGKAPSVISEYYIQGCRNQKYLPLRIGSRAFVPLMNFGLKEDDIRWLDPQEVEMIGSVYMRKTEKGWKAVD